VNDKNKLWRDWWSVFQGNKTPAGSYNPIEENMWKAWNAGWYAAKQICCNHECNEGRNCPARE
jgi:hypothetical protein